ncbi:MAG TPA: hypothetical protein VMT89_06935 [Candidatus Acidoferrales bacterium]|nr:hypothetical protein [Candidatus Acidoferrales bacterium]
MKLRTSFLFITIALTLGLVRTTTAQESPADWIKRIFDPTTLGIQQFPNAELSRKLSVDAIILERGGPKRIGVWIIPLDQMRPAAAHFAKQFGTSAQVNGADSAFESHVFDFTSDPKAPAKYKGLKVVITHSPYVDGKGQITMEYTPPTGN